MCSNRITPNEVNHSNLFLELDKKNLDSILEQKTSLIYEISNASKVVLKLVIGLMVHFTSPEMFVLSFE